MHVDDLFGALVHLASHPQSSGAYNLAAPEPVTNRQFARDLGRVLHRPSFLPVPEFAVRPRAGNSPTCCSRASACCRTACWPRGSPFSIPGSRTRSGPSAPIRRAAGRSCGASCRFSRFLGGCSRFSRCRWPRSDCCLRSIFNRKPGGESSDRNSSLALAPFVDFVRYFSKPADHPGGVFASWFCWLFLALLLFARGSRAGGSPPAHARVASPVF